MKTIYNAWHLTIFSLKYVRKKCILLSFEKTYFYDYKYIYIYIYIYTHTQFTLVMTAQNNRKARCENGFFCAC